MATRHAALPAGGDEQLLVDIDLAILGASAARFAEYERQIRAEYAFVRRSGLRGAAPRRPRRLPRSRAHLRTARLHDELEQRGARQPRAGRSPAHG